MAYELNPKIKELEPYDPINGEYRIRLDANESFMDLPVDIHVELIEKLMQVRFNRYPDPLAADVCRLFAEYYSIDPSLVTASNGSDELLSIITSTFLMKGEKVLTVTPDFSMYGFYGHLYENPVITLKTDDKDEIDIDKMIETANNEKVAMIIFSNPSNPTGRGINADQARRIVKSVNSLVVLDEAYMDFWDQSLISEVENYDNLIVLKTFSKAFGMAGVRLGFAVANKTFTKALHAVKSPYNVNSLTQAAACAVLKDPYRLREAVDKIKLSRDALFSGICGLAEKYPGKLSANESFANFVYVKFENTEDVFDKLLVQGIAVRKLGDHLRITAGSEYENRELLNALDVILKD